MLRGKHILRLLIAGLVLAYVAIAAVQYSQYRSVEAVMRRGDVNALWSFLQLNVEYEKLDHALHQYELAPTSITIDQLELRYDLFLSRFSALESGTARTLMQDELLGLWSGTGGSVVFVTHDLEEAIALADRVFVLSARPATLKRVYDIDLPRPRVMSQVRYDPQFIDLSKRIWDDLREEVVIH